MPASLAEAAARLLAELPAIAGETVPDDLGAALRALPAVGALPSPWEVWTLLGLARHLARQEWVRSVVRERLLTHPGWHPTAVPQHGDVPGLPGWQYVFHGRGCCLSRADSGEVIDVDFVDDTAEHFDTYFYAAYIDSLREPDVPEDRLIRVCPERSLLVLAIEDLQAAEILLRGSHRVYFRLGPALWTATAAIDAVSRALADPSRRLWLAARLGDWPWARELATDPSLHAELDARAQQCLALRRARLERELAGGDAHTVQMALTGLAALAVDDLPARLLMALEGPPDGVVSTALELMGRGWRADYADPVLALQGRVDPHGEVPQPHIFATCAVLLLTNDCHVETVLGRIADAGEEAGARLLTLALAFRSPAALGLVRLGLRSRVPMYRAEAAALLAAIDRPWTRRELLAVLAESDDLEMTSQCCAALRRSADPLAREALESWLRRHPYTPPAGPPYTFLDVTLASGDDDLEWYIDDHAEFFDSYRERIGDPDRLHDA